MTIEIRPETPADIPAIAQLTQAAFSTVPHSSGTEHLIIDSLREAGQLTLSLVACDAQLIVGHIALSPIRIALGHNCADGHDAEPSFAPGWYGLGPVSVLPERQRQGIGTQLIRSAIEALHAHHAAGCVLLGEPAYYERFGFRAIPRLLLAGVPPEYFLAMTFGHTFPVGMVHYHESFQAGSTVPVQ